MRVYLPAGLDALEELRLGREVDLAAVVPASDDELDEFDALRAAAEQQGDVVIAADVERPDAPVSIDRVASFHLDADGSGDLAWYAPQELDQVIALLRP
ncbi:MAG TPA: hypothetical protein VMZ66_05475 [Aeromicrobium sp.]|nr:hypothetical protein [Aeromicrobium sp.]